MWRINYFDMSADDPNRAMNFYTKVFGWKFKKWNGPFDYWLAITGDSSEKGIDGGIGRRQEPGDHVLNFIDVPSIDAVSKLVVENGGMIVRDKQSVPGVGFMVIIQDPEKNRIGLIQQDSNAP